MASIVVQADISVENEAGVEKWMEKFRAHLERHAKNATALVNNGLYIGPVLKGQHAAMHPTVSVLVSCWDTAGNDLREFAQDMTGMFYFEGLSVIGLD